MEFLEFWELAKGAWIGDSFELDHEVEWGIFAKSGWYVGDFLWVLVGENFFENLMLMCGWNR